MFHPEMTHQPFWSMEVLDVLKVLKTPLEGLSEEEVLRRRAVTGLNLFRDGAGDSSLRILLRQFQSPFIIVLLLAAILTFVLKEWVDAAVILAAITANTILGFWQEQKAETVLEKLKSYIQIHVRVRRRGREKEVDASELVPGDVIRLSRGDRVPADARLIQVTGLEVDESVLTGESLPVVKRIESVDLSTILPERVSMVYGGTLVQQGFAEAMITVTGYHTEFGKIAALVKAGDQDKTPLQRAVQKFSATLGKIFLFFMGVLFFLGLAVGYPLFDMLLLTVAVAVSVIPEGLPIALTVILAVGVERLAKRKGIVKKLLAAETLGSTSIILTDKTGTLTKAQMQLVAVLPYKHDEEAEAQQHLLQDALINLEAMIENPEDAPAEWKVSGRPMEAALVREAGIRGVHLPVVLRTVTFVERLPFRSDTKYSASLVSSGSKLRAVIFGAPDILLRFTHLSDQEKRELHQEIERRALSGERVLGVISKVITDVKEFAQNHAWHEYVFEGLLTFRDPLRSGVKEAIARMAKAGVKTVIVTGDHRGTAEAVAREIGLIDGEGAVITGDELAAFSPEELDGFLPRIHVFARVTPEQKMFLVRWYQARGEVVAVTGDGVNDAPALQTADMGVAVGSGTEVAKSAADLIILDDNFLTIVAAIEEGRRIFSNIRKVIVFLLCNSADELFLIGGSLLAGIALPLNALQILFVNFFSDSFPAVAFAFDREGDALGHKPMRVQSHLLDGSMRFYILVVGILSSGFLFSLYILLLKLGFPSPLVRTFIFASFATYTLFLSFALRNLRKSIFQYHPFSNRHLNIGVMIGVGLTLLTLYLPIFQKVFGTVALPVHWLAGVFVVGAFNVTALELAKWYYRHKEPLRV